MKYSLTIVALVLLASCGKEPSDSDIRRPLPIPKMSIFNDFEAVVPQPVSTDPAIVFAGPVITQLNLSSLSLRADNDANLVFPCKAPITTLAVINGVEVGDVAVVGTEQAGYIQFGHLYYKISDGVYFSQDCYKASHEAYDYRIEGDTLTLTQVKAYPITKGSSTLVHFATVYKKKQ
jgi:hypothetical protein